MKISVLLIYISLLLTIFIPSCATPAKNPQSALPAPDSSIEPENLSQFTPTPTRPPAVAAVIFETDSCRYEGPEILPATDSLTINWRIKTKGASVYALTAFITDQERSREDLKNSFQGLDMHRPALPAGLTSAGNNLGLAGENKYLNFRIAGGKLHGLLYFSCWDAEEVYEVLGPIELK